MGLKDAAKALMEKAGVPVVPGYHGADQDPAHLAAEADKIGYPVLIKAVAGGGGKGMRLVEDPEGFAEALESAMGEAKTAFGNDAVLIEKYIQKPRHIEMQVFGDGTACRASVRARLFPSAPSPEGDRGSSGAGHDRRGAQCHGAGGRARSRGDWL